MPALMYGRLPYRALKGEVDFDGGVVKAALAGVYDMDVDTHDRWTDFVEADVTGLYSTGGILVENFSLEYQPDQNRVALLGDHCRFLTLSSEVIRGVLFYLDDGATKPLISYHRFEQFRVINNAPFTYYLKDRLIAQFRV